jgi:spore germination protein YaaH
LNRSATRRGPLVARIAAVVLLLASTTAPASAAGLAAPLPAPQTAAVSPSAGVPAGEPTPTIHYLDAMAHAADVIDFQPGDRVTLGFTPTASNSWPVDGARPGALPAGRVSGGALRLAPTGSVWSGAPAERRGPPTPASSSGDVPVDGAIGPTVAGTVTSSGSADPAAGVASPPAAVVNPDGLRREVFGFVPYWELSDSSTTYDWSVLSTVAYFSVGATSAGNLLKQNADGSVTTGWGGWTSSKMTSLITAAHQHHTRVVLTISCFAWTTGQQTTQSTLLGSATARSNLAKQIAAAVAERGADGVNLDFEPIVSGYADEFTAFVRTVRSELDAIAPGYQLTFDTTGWIGNYPIEDATAAGGADAIFIMGYDYRGSSAAQAGSLSPLTGPVYDLTDTVAAYAARVSPSKLILGVPYYGRAWSTDTDALHAKNISGTQYGTSVTAVYGAAADLAAQYGRRYDSVEQAPWTAYTKQTCTTTYGCVTAWRELYYDDAASLKLRYDLVNRTGLRGAGIWALGYDGTRPELYKALADKFLHDTTAPVVGISALATSQSNAGFPVAWVGHDESSMASYDVQVAVDGGAWTDWRTGTTAESSIYLGTSGHAYAFRARGRDSHGNVSAWGVTSTSTAASLAPGGFGSVQVDALKLRAAAGTSAAIVGTVNTGDIVAVTGGPVDADGYTWYEVTAPIAQWGPVDPAETGVWLAGGSSSVTYVTPRMPINATTVDAVIRNLKVGSGGQRLVTPNADGLTDTIAISWVATTALDALALHVWSAGGKDLGSVAIGATGAGSHATTWDGRVGGTVVADGTYVLQLVGAKGASSYAAPSVAPVSTEQLAAFGVTVDHLPVSRLAGPDRYATAAAISAATFDPGVPVVYLATGLNFPDALAGAAAAGATGGPLLLATRDSLPPATAAELARLKPARIVVLGATGVVGTSVSTAAKAAADG